MVERLAQGHQALAEGRPVQHAILPRARPARVAGFPLAALAARFYALRGEHAGRGHGVPPESAMRPHRSDM